MTAADEGTCRDCGARIRWVITEGGRRVVLDVNSVDGGNVVLTVDATGHRRARVLGGDELPAEGPAWRRHSQTCTESPDARKARARAAPHCTVCHDAMDPDLTRLEGWTTHPSCDPEAHADTVRAAFERATRREAT